MKLYKLTTQDNKTRKGESNETIWGPGITHKVKGKNYDLCSSDLIHAYESPELAVIMNPVHANITDPVLWEAKTKCRKIINSGLKVGVKSLTTIRIIDVPVITEHQRVRFAILCVLKIYKEKLFVKWAKNWLSGKDQFYDMAETERAAERAGAAWSAAEAAAAGWAAEAAWAAAGAAWAAAGATRVEAARAAVRTGVAWSARAAACVAEARAGAKVITFQSLLLKAIKDEERMP